MTRLPAENEFSLSPAQLGQLVARVRGYRVPWRRRLLVRLARWRFVAAAVMVLFDGEGGILLTRRPATLATHAGQVAFPGGKVDRADAGVAAAALRETEEEVGIGRGVIGIQGALPPLLTPTGFRITPVVGFVQKRPLLVLNPAEVEAAFYLPQSVALDGSRYRPRVVQHRGWRIHSVALDYEVFDIWGATALMLQALAWAAQELGLPERETR